MAYNSPLWNEETGWAALDNLTPQQTAMIQANPGLITGGMPSGIFNENAGGAGASYPYMTTYQDPAVSAPGGSRNRGNPVTPTGMSDPSFANNNPAFNSLMMPVNNGMVQGELPAGTSQNQNPVIGSSSLLFAPTGAQVAQNPGQWAGTSFDPTRNLMSGLNYPTGGANSMGMQGAESVGGVGMYTGANAPLNMSLFAPQGQDVAMMQGSMGGLGEALYKAAQAGGLNPNTSYLGFIDDLSRRALAAKGGQGGLLPQDFVNYMNSQAGQQWFQGMRAPASQAPGTPTGSPVVQQTGPQNPPVAPTPQPGRAQSQPLPGSDMQSTYQNLIQQGYSPQQAQQFIQQLSMPTPPGAIGSMRADPYRNFESNNPGQPGYNPNFGSGNYGGPQVDPAQGNMLQNIPMTPQQRQQYEIGMNRYRQGGTYFDPAYVEYLLANQMQPGQNPYQMGQQTPVIGSPGIMVRPTSGLQMTPEQAQSYGVSSRQLTPEEQAWYRQYGTLAGLPGQARFANQQQIPNPSGGYYPQAPNSVYSPEELQQYSRIAQPNWNDLTDYGRQQLGMPTAAQWAQMQGGQQAQPQYGQQQDFRAATYGTQPQTPAPAGGSGSIPNTTNPLNPLTSQQQYATPGWGSATNRRSGFGNTSLFGTSYGSGGSTGFGGTSPSQFRGAGIYGRPASYGQSQRPY